MANDLRFQGVPMTTSTNVTRSTTVGLRDTRGLTSDWQAGTHFSRYEIDSKLATGGMAEVWRAKLKGVRGFEKRIVIKTMLPQLAGRPDLVEMFINEATLASAFSHANIAHVFDFGQLEGRYFIGMEYVPGVTLRFAHKRMLARGELLPMAATLHVMIDVCEALHEVHELCDRSGTLGLIHRDLSPDNVIVSTSGAAKLIDFGAARATTRTPVPSVFVGKYRYAAPERVRRTSEDRRSDLYSAGVILFECLTGGRPYDGPDQVIIQAVASGRLYDPRDRLPSLPAAVAEVVMRAMAADPADRFATARQMREALTRCLNALGASNREHDVTASLAALMETPEPAPILLAPVEAVPEAIETAARAFVRRRRRALRGRDHRSLGADPDVERADRKRFRRTSGWTAAAAGDPEPRARQHRGTVVAAAAVSQGRSVGAALEPARPAVRAGVRRAERDSARPPRVATHARAAAARQPPFAAPAGGRAVRSGDRAARGGTLRRGAPGLGTGGRAGAREPCLPIERRQVARAARRAPPRPAQIGRLEPRPCRVRF